jgi:hypothetical protein
MIKKYDVQATNNRDLVLKAMEKQPDHHYKSQEPGEKKSGKQLMISKTSRYVMKII